MHRFFLLPLLMLPAIAIAQSPPPDAVGPEPPELPLPVESGETLEPDITIIRRGKKTIQEYRINGQLYMIKIIPDIGPPYYMIDKDHDGTMEIQRSGLDETSYINQWKIFSW